MEKSIFDLEVREKKNQAFLNKAKTGAKGGSSSRKGMRTPYDFMSSKEKKNLNGEVMVSNMFETILTKEEFDLKPVETQKELLSRWRNLYSNGKIMHEMGLKGNATFTRLLEKLDIPKKRATGPKGPRKAKVSIAQVDQKPTLLEFALEQAPEITPEPPKEVPAVLITQGLHLEYNGEYDCEQLSKIFTKLQLLTDGEPHKFKISLSLTECEK